MRICRKTNKNTKICCDATGGLVHKIGKVRLMCFLLSFKISYYLFLIDFIRLSVRPTGKNSGHIFMYTLVIADGFLCPIWTMLSEINNANFITFWLNKWLRLGGKVPNEYCCGMSLAILNAGVCAFTD